jgi:hypothetical protein
MLLGAEDFAEDLKLLVVMLLVGTDETFFVDRTELSRDSSLDEAILDLVGLDDLADITFADDFIDDLEETPPCEWDDDFWFDMEDLIDETLVIVIEDFAETFAEERDECTLTDLTDESLGEDWIDDFAEYFPEEWEDDLAM